MTNLIPLRDFVVATTRAFEGAALDEPARLAQIKPLLAALIARDDWLPPECAAAGPEHYRQYLLHADPLGRFSVVSFVWGPGQRTPVHDHRVFGLVGVLCGAETSTSYLPSPGGPLIAGPMERLERGDVVAVSPRIGDIHAVANAYDDRISISIHIYGGNIGEVRRAVFDPATGIQKPFVSGYSNAAVPNLWNLVEAA